MSRASLAAGLVCVACSTPVADTGSLADSNASGTDEVTGVGTSTVGGDSSTGSSSSSGGSTVKLDVGVPTGGGNDTGPADLCTVPRDDNDAPGPCDYQAPPDSFDPVVQWEWTGDGPWANSATTPLVANLTDDNGDGAVDLCDTPDVVVLAWAEFLGPARLYVLDGQTGTEHFHIEMDLDDINPALGDIDGDGLPEIVAQRFEGGAIAFEHDGEVAWESSARTWPRFNAISLADLEGDDDVEILMPGGVVLDHNGMMLVESYLGAAGVFWEGSTPFAIDFDGDGDLEIIDGRRVFHHDGAPLWQQSSNECPQPPDGADVMPAVADLDKDGEPEVFLSAYDTGGAAMFCVLGPGGEVELTQAALPAAPDAIDWARPPAIHDIDGDNDAEVGVGGSPKYFAVLQVDGGELTPMFIASDVDDSGNAGATAFDFLGDGTAEAIYMDHTRLVAYDADGNVKLSVARSSYTQIEYPVVADIDNDGSAEFLVTSNGGQSPVRAFHDAGDRWVPARRIWNQHAYHVTNVREDGTIPAKPAKHWEQLNTFRTQAQIAVSGGTCDPEG